MLRFSPNTLATFEIVSKKYVIRSVEPKLLPTATVADKKWVIRIVEVKLLPTATVADKKWVIRSERPILPIPSRHDSVGYLWGR